MCNNFPNIRITEGNNFSIILPLLSRTYVATRPLDEEIDPEQLENVVVTFGGVQYTPQLTAQGVQIDLPATLAVGAYNILLTAEYLGSNIRAAYESAVTIVPWSEQSTAEQYITGSPIVLRAAYVLSGAMTDAELEALKEEYREKNAQLEQAIADAEAAKREWEEKASDLDGVAKQGDNPDATNTAILEAVQQGGGTDIAKESTSQQILTKIGSPASGQGADLFAAMRDIALSATTLQELANAWSAMVTNRESLSGWVFLPQVDISGVSAIAYNYNQAVEVHDNTTELDLYGSSATTYLNMPNGASWFRDGWQNLKILHIQKLTRLRGRELMCNLQAIEKISLPSLYLLGGMNTIHTLPMLRECYLPSVTKILSSDYSFFSFAACPNLIDLTLGAITSSFAISSWSPTNALDANSQTLLTVEDIAAGFTNNLEKLLYNIREHIAANLPVAPNTITFSAEVKAAILADQPTADAFTNKNWTIA